MVKNQKTTKAATPAENMRGSAYMALSMAGYALNDIVIKYLSGSIEIGQSIFIRGLFAVAIIFILAKSTGKLRPLKVAFRPAILIRSVSEMLATITFLIALFNIPIANTTAILQALPLMVALGAAFFFGETIGWRRIIAILVGFVGVLIIVRPGMEGFTYYSLPVIGTILFATVRDLSTRMIPDEIPSLFIALITAILVTMMGGALYFFEDWQPIQTTQVAWLALAAGFLIVGYSTIAAAMRVGDVSFIVPFRYTILLYAILSGIIFFDEIPDFYTMLGSAIIIATGIYTLYRERVAKRD